MRRIVPVLIAVLAVLLLMSRSTQLFGAHQEFTAELPDAAGLRAGDQVQVAGIAVGEVTSVAAVGDRVKVGFRLDSDVPLTRDTRTEVKLATLLGTRYLALAPGRGAPLGAGDTLDLAEADGSYMVEKLWLDNGRKIGEFDLDTLSKAVDVLSTDLNGSPTSTRQALDGLASLAETVGTRDEQLGRLLVATRKVTDEAVAQRAQLTTLMDRGDAVFAMVADRKQAIDALLRDGRKLVLQLTTLAKRTTAPMTAALRRLRALLDVLTQHRDELGEVLAEADPALRLYVNSAGDGAWLGVNAPALIAPDSFWCLTRKDIGC